MDDIDIDDDLKDEDVAGSCVDLPSI